MTSNRNIENYVLVRGLLTGWLLSKGAINGASVAHNFPQIPPPRCRSHRRCQILDMLVCSSGDRTQDATSQWRESCSPPSWSSLASMARWPGCPLAWGAWCTCAAFPPCTGTCRSSWQPCLGNTWAARSTGPAGLRRRLAARVLDCGCSDCARIHRSILLIIIWTLSKIYKHLPRSSATMKSTLGCVGFGVVEIVSLSAARERPGREERRRNEVWEFGKRDRAPLRNLRRCHLRIWIFIFSPYLETKVQSVTKMEGILSSSGRMTHHVVRYKLFTFLLDS